MLFNILIPYVMLLKVQCDVRNPYATLSIHACIVRAHYTSQQPMQRAICDALGSTWHVRISLCYIHMCRAVCAARYVTTYV